MPFDKISPGQLFIMRVVTALTLIGIGAGLVFLSGTCVLEPEQCTSRFAGPTDGAFTFVALMFGVFLANAGVMLIELTTKPPFKMAINVPFVAANFQTALCFGLVAVTLAVKHASLSGEASGDIVLVQGLCIAGFVLNLVFVLMTKMHWNFTENTGKPLPEA